MLYAEAKVIDKDSSRDIKLFRLQHSTLSNLLLLPETPIHYLEKELLTIHVVLERINARLAEFHRIEASIKKLVAQAEEIKNLNGQQLMEMESTIQGLITPPAGNIGILSAGYGKIVNRLSLGG